MAASPIQLAREVGRVRSMTVPLDADQEKTYQRLAEEAVMVDVHQHPMVLPEDLGQFMDYLRARQYRWGYEAVKHGGWTAVATANVFRGLLNSPDISFIDFEDLLAEISGMVADLAQQKDVVRVGNADDIEAAGQGRVFAHGGAPGHRQPAGPG